MSGAEGGGVGRKGLLASLMGTLRRSSARQEQPKPVPEDLGLKTLRHVSFIFKFLPHTVLWLSCINLVTCTCSSQCMYMCVCMCMGVLVCVCERVPPRCLPFGYNNYGHAADKILYRPLIHYIYVCTFDVYIHVNWDLVQMCELSWNLGASVHLQSLVVVSLITFLHVQVLQWRVYM